VRTKSTSFGQIVGAIALTLLACGASPAQEPEFNDTPYADRQWEIGRRFDESKLRYCVDPRDADWEIGETIADAIAAALLLEPERYVVESQFVQEDITKVYALMLEQCDLYLGFKLIPEGYADWLAITRAYYESDYVFVSADPDLRSLAELPAGSTISATIGTSAHILLVSYIRALPPDQRWRAFPSSTNDAALESLLNGSVDLALVWAPNLWARQRADAAYIELHAIEPTPLAPTRLGVGAIVLSDQKFLRNAIDEAIAALSADGTFQQIIDSYDFPARTVP
jgi:polar amino acid transport system substrate-binding protein